MLWLNLQSLKSGWLIPDTYLILLGNSSLEGQMGMPVWLAGRSLWIPMEDGEDMVEVLSQAKTAPKLTGLLPTLLDGLLKISAPMDSARDAWSKLPTVSASLNPWASMWTVIIRLQQVLDYISRIHRLRSAGHHLQELRPETRSDNEGPKIERGQV